MQSDQFNLHADIEQRHWWFVGRRRIVQRLIEDVLPPSRDTIVVDVGCGTGANIAALADRYRCVGIDTSTQAIELAAERFPDVQFMTGFAPGDLGDLAGQASMFTMMDVLEHVSDDFALVSELAAAASPGTYFLLTVPADESLWSEHDESFGHYRRYDRDRFASVWVDLPVKTLMFSHFNSRLCPLIRAIRAKNRLLGGASGRVGTDFWLPNRPVNSLLEATFAGESARLLGLLHGRRKRPYRRGASLIALLRREEGSIAVRNKPQNLAPDHVPAEPVAAG